MNKMYYEYLKNHAYVSYNKKSTYDFELSKERAECMANKYNSSTCELQKENQELKKQLHDASIQIQELIEKDIWCPSNCEKLEQLQQENKRLYNLNNTIFRELLDKKYENKKQKEVIDKIMNLIKQYGKYDGKKCTCGFQMWSADFNKVLDMLKEVSE